MREEHHRPKEPPDTPPPPGPDTACAVTLPVRTTLWVLGSMTALVLGIHVGLQCVHYLWHPLPRLLIDFFDVDIEDSFPTWWNETLLLCAAGLFGVIAVRKAREGDRWTAHWRGLFAGFLYLAMDEIAGVHETINTITPFSWAIPGLLAALGVGLIYLGFLVHLPRRTALLMVVAGSVYLAGAAGVEWATDPFFNRHGALNLAYNLFNAIEEGLEMSGVVLIIYTLLDYLRPRPSVRITAT